MSGRKRRHFAAASVNLVCARINRDLALFRRELARRRQGIGALWPPQSPYVRHSYGRAPSGISAFRSNRKGRQENVVCHALLSRRKLTCVDGASQSICGPKGIRARGCVTSFQFPWMPRVEKVFTRSVGSETGVAGLVRGFHVLLWELAERDGTFLYMYTSQQFLSV